MRKATRAFVICFCMATVNLIAYTSNPSVRVGGWSLRANGQVAQGFQYTGHCPVNLKFGWGIIASEPTSMTYRFIRNDGGHSSKSFTVDLPQAGRSVPVYEDWQLGANTPEFATYRGWVNLIVESPNRLEKKIDFTVHCR